METQLLPIVRWRVAAPTEALADAVAVEEPLEIRVNGRSVAVTMRTPGGDRELAAGFLLTEGVLRRREDLLDLLVCRTQEDGESGNVIDAQVCAEVAVDFARLTRHVFSASSCGVCGKATIAAAMGRFPRLDDAATFAPEVLASLPEKLRAGQRGFGETGGMHGCALFSGEGELLAVREDVGRHNALDKLIGGEWLAERVPLRERLLLVSGRVSFELVQKALVAGIPLIAGIGAPSSLAVACAREGGQTLVGFLQGERMNVYAGGERLGLATAGKR